jgi:hypothetical protein
MEKWKRPRDWTSAAALCFAMLVLTGLHTFDGMMREAPGLRGYSS